MKHNLDRRHFLKTAATSAAAVAACGLFTLPAAAQEKLSPSDPTAKALNYTEDAAKVDPAKAPTFKKGSHCANCALYQTAAAKGDYAPCGAFGGRLVAGKGWCAAWAAKA
ncbi:high-potential iron-sulfur protein [Solimonas variicoloris]|uniref:high-potential iron-sulfur protein n=1 Tax=Solimonas variicoloris TaxID=254408 RepID=UPI00037D25FD|nr:high-potential iron-sulfur protein [Solimonas variicoloris]